MGSRRETVDTGSHGLVEKLARYMTTDHPTSHPEHKVLEGTCI